jgi:hypothetical protein
MAIIIEVKNKRDVHVNESHSTGRAAGIETAAHQKNEISNESASMEKNKSITSGKQQQQQPREWDEEVGGWTLGQQVGQRFNHSPVGALMP